MGRHIIRAIVGLVMVGTLVVVGLLLYNTDGCSYEERMYDHRCRQLGEGYEGDANYRTALDQDRDGISCEGRL
jgi:hypothetical protein